MALSDITKKIASDAQAKVADIEKKAKDEVSEINSRADAKVKDFEEKTTTDRTRRSEKVYGRIVAKAQHDIKLAKDTHTRTIVDAVFMDVQKGLMTMSAEKYSKFVNDALLKLPQEAGVFTIAKEKEKETKELLPAKDSVEVAHEGTLLGGFVFATNDREYDYSFKAILESLRRKHEITVSQKLLSKSHE